MQNRGMTLKFYNDTCMSVTSYKIPQWTPPNCNNSVSSLIDHKRIVVYYHWILPNSRLFGDQTHLICCWSIPQRYNKVSTMPKFSHVSMISQSYQVSDLILQYIERKHCFWLANHEFHTSGMPVLMCSLLVIERNVHNTNYANYRNP